MERGGEAVLEKVFLVYWAAVNLLAFASMGLDKRRAKRNQWRIPERTLFALALLGGSVGSWLGMRVFHHKTRHRIFTIGVPLIFFVQLAAAYFICQAY